jgi:hypothetical protein
MTRAAKKGATHIVWTRMASGYGGGNASGRAYKCESAQKPITGETSRL